ncbi:MAG: hypothetical protein WBD31_23020 [Rubripirellula sp.]
MAARPNYHLPSNFDKPIPTKRKQVPASKPGALPAHSRWEREAKLRVQRETTVESSKWRKLAACDFLSHKMEA